MLIDFGDGWVVNTEHIIFSRPHPDDEDFVLVSLMHTSSQLKIPAEVWAIGISEVVDASVTEIRAAAAAFAEAHKPDGEIVMHDMGKRKNEAKK